MSLASPFYVNLPLRIQGQHRKAFGICYNGQNITKGVSGW